MIADNVKQELRSPPVLAAIILVLISVVFGALTGNAAVPFFVTNVVVALYVIYLFIRLVLAVETIAFDE